MKIDDREGFLLAFGVPCRVKGQLYTGIIEDDYELVELGRMRIESNAPDVLFIKPDVSRMVLALRDTLSVWDIDTEEWTNFVVSSIQPRSDGFTLVKLIEAA